MMRDRKDLDTSYLGGPFDRQVRIDDWDQRKLEQQAVLILGVGGLGSIVAINLLRLGVGKLFFVDYDVVDIHNLNRQLLYTHEDVGKSKVESAYKNAQFHNAGKTQIEYFHGNALTNWEKIVGFLKQSTFVFNCIDWGDKFDAAVSSACLQLKIPLVMGGTFAVSMTVDFYPQTGSPCFICLDDTTRSYQRINDIVPEKILEYKDISFLPRNNNPIGRSSVVVCTICGEIMTSQFLNWVCLVEQKPMKTSRVMFYHNNIELIKFQELELCKDCPFCLKYHPVKVEETPAVIAEGKEEVKVEIKENDIELTKEEGKEEVKVETASEEKPKETQENKSAVEVGETVVVEAIAEAKIEASTESVPITQPKAIESE